MEPSQINDDSPAASLPISHDSPTFQLDTLKDNSKVKSSTFPVNEEAADAVQIDIDSTDPSDIQDNAVGDRRSTGVSEIDNNPAEITARRSLSRVSSSSNGDSCYKIECLHRCLESPMLNRIINSGFVKVVKRFIPLMLSIWMLIDVGLDAHQTSTFYGHAFQLNGTYSQWSQEYGIKNETGINRLQKVSPWYFYVACSIWITPPFLVSMVSSIINFCAGSDLETNNPFGFTAGYVEETFNLHLQPFPYGKYFNVIIFILFLPADIVVSSVCVYIIIPAASLKSSLIIAWKGSIDEENFLIGRINTARLPWLKLFEHLGEALPQIILALVFCSNNFPFLSVHDTSFVPIPTTIISIFFSCGSLCMGLYTGYKACKAL